MTGFLEIEIECVNSRGDRYDVRHAGDLIAAASGDCLHDAAVELVAAGADMDDTIVMYGKGEAYPRMYARVGYAAGHVVKSNRFVEWPQNSGGDID